MQSSTYRHRTRSIVFLPCQSIDLFSVSLYHNLEWNGTERNGTENQTTQLCWNINVKIFTQSLLVQMIVNDKNEVQPCRLLPRDVGREVFFFLACQSIHLFSVFLYHYLERNGTEQNRKMDKQLWNKFECSCLEIFLGGKVDWF